MKDQPEDDEFVVIAEWDEGKGIRVPGGEWREFPSTEVRAIDWDSLSATYDDPVVIFETFPDEDDVTP